MPRAPPQVRRQRGARPGAHGCGLGPPCPRVWNAGPAQGTATSPGECSCLLPVPGPFAALALGLSQAPRSGGPGSSRLALEAGTTWSGQGVLNPSPRETHHLLVPQSFYWSLGGGYVSGHFLLSSLLPYSPPCPGNCGAGAQLLFISSQLSMVPPILLEPVATAWLGNLLKMQTLRPHLKPMERETVERSR